MRDDLEHRLTECDDADAIWPWLQQRLSVLLGTLVQPAAMLRPDFRAKDKATQAAALWLTGHTVAYLARGCRVIADEFQRTMKREKQSVLNTPQKWPVELLNGLKTHLLYL